MSPGPHRPQVSSPTSADTGAALTIGDLAKRTGLAPATLRMWESRHGFPVPERLDSGHRRYRERDVGLVLEALRQRDSGIRLDQAIAQVTRARDSLDRAPGVPSIFAALRARHPGLQPQRLRKATLMALSRAIEDECCARAASPVIFGAFQQGRHFRSVADRWTELSRMARANVVFAAFGEAPEPVAGTTFVHLPEDAPMRREWAVVCDSPEFSALLTAWELPGQSGVADRQRLFEAIWTVHRGAVRDAARACAQVAVQLGTAEAGRLLYELSATTPDPPPELVHASSLLNRVVAYVDDLSGA